MAPAVIAATIGGKVALANTALPWLNVLLLGILAGAYLGFGGLAAILVYVDAVDTVSFGLSR